MKILAKYHVCNHCVIGEKTSKNILIGPGKLTGTFEKRAPGPWEGPGCVAAFWAMDWGQTEKTSPTEI